MRTVPQGKRAGTTCLARLRLCWRKPFALISPSPALASRREPQSCCPTFFLSENCQTPFNRHRTGRNRTLSGGNLAATYIGTEFTAPSASRGLLLVSCRPQRARHARPGSQTRSRGQRRWRSNRPAPRHRAAPSISSKLVSGFAASTSAMLRRITPASRLRSARNSWWRWSAVSMAARIAPSARNACRHLRRRTPIC